MSHVLANSDVRQVAAEAGIRLDRALADALPDLSRSRIKNLILGGLVGTAGSTITDPSYRVKPAEVFSVTVPQPTEIALEGEDIPLDIIFEDESLLVIDKPAGLTVHPGAGQPSGTLVNALIAHCGNSLSGIGGVKRPGIVHRLDKDTSGLIVVAKSDSAHASLATQFESRTVDRAYRAIVWGVPMPPNGEIEGNIGRSHKNRTKMTVVRSDRGKPALTRYHLLTAFGDTTSFIECRLATGRTHQIRVHMTHIGHPLIGDPAYGRATSHRRAELSSEALTIATSLGRQALHATELGFEHPNSGAALKFESKLPHDIQLLVERLTADNFPK